MFRKGLDKNGGRKHTGSKQAQHNCALFPCQEYNRIFFKGVNIRYHNYAELLSGKLGMPADFIQGMTYLFVRACVHFALFEDEDYLQLQLNAIRTSLRAFIAMKTGSENWKAGGAHE